jgi:hypothetical protein
MIGLIKRKKKKWYSVIIVKEANFSERRKDLMSIKTLKSGIAL